MLGLTATTYSVLIIRTKCWGYFQRYNAWSKHDQVFERPYSLGRIWDRDKRQQMSDEVGRGDRRDSRVENSEGRFATSEVWREACAGRAIKSAEDLSSFHIVFNDFLLLLTNVFDGKSCPRHSRLQPVHDARIESTPHLAMPSFFLLH